MGLVYQKNPKSGVVYVYENSPYWDRERQQSRARRKLIGRLDPLTGAVVPTGGRGGGRTRQSLRPEPEAACVGMARDRWQEALDRNGLPEDLAASVPGREAAILALARSLLWADRRAFPQGLKGSDGSFPPGAGVPVSAVTPQEEEAFFRRREERWGQGERSVFLTGPLTEGLRLRPRDSRGRGTGPLWLPGGRLLAAEDRATGMPLRWRRIWHAADAAALLKQADGFGGVGPLILGREFSRRRDLAELLARRRNFLLRMRPEQRLLKPFLEEARGRAAGKEEAAEGFRSLRLDLVWDARRRLRKSGAAPGDELYLFLYISHELKTFRKEALEGFREALRAGAAGDRSGSAETALEEALAYGEYTALLSDRALGPEEAWALWSARETLTRDAAACLLHSDTPTFSLRGIGPRGALLAAFAAVSARRAHPSARDW